MTKINVTLDHDQLTEIIRQSLMEDYNLNNLPDHVDCSDWEIDPDNQLLKALEQVIDYYSTPDQFAEWKKTLEKSEWPSINQNAGTS